ncbi:TetR family transcriptional regulator [Pseudoduganella sp. FT26W]|uniref:TetR family transcriptional regulator n=1 Tax=Duganella aquatilis TaxID=2666082 RepID=A0A844D5S9_9BURK|nr:TetR/AcrR family transcriptional regulator [Duganella aquatilis]MRW83466.1 TetR family transcriptional regulator [Duganella aquatilis]
MGRKRVIDQEQILDAAEKVVARDGAARLTLESVAEVAGISKASVLYDFKSKQALIAAVVERAVRNDNAFNDGVTASLGELPSAAIRGRIAAAAQPLPEAFRATALNLCAALAQDRELRATVQNNQAAIAGKIVADAAHPRGALLAYLALEGLKLLEAMDLYHLPTAQRSQVLADIAWLVDAK